MVHPIFFVGTAATWAVKHVNGWVLYYTAKTYGFPRLYRRLCEINKRIITDPSRRQDIQNTIKLAMRLPSQSYSVLRTSKMYDYLDKVQQDLKRTRSGSFLAAFLNTITTRTNVVKVLKELEEAAVKDIERHKKRVE